MFTATAYNVPKWKGQKNKKDKNKSVIAKKTGLRPGLVHFAHNDFVLVLNMMIGIQKSLNTVV